MSMKNSNDTIGNRTRDLRNCSAVPQPTALRRAPYHIVVHDRNIKKQCTRRSTVSTFTSAEALKSAVLVGQNSERNA